VRTVIVVDVVVETRAFSGARARGGGRARRRRPARALSSDAIFHSFGTRSMGGRRARRGRFDVSYESVSERFHLPIARAASEVRARAVASRGGDPVGGALDSTSFESRLNSGVSDGRRRLDASDGWMRRGVGWMHRDGRCGEKTDDGNVRVFSTRVAQGVRHGVEVEVSRARDTSMAVS